MEKDAIAALESSIHRLRGRAGPGNDPLLFVRMVANLQIAIKEIERLRKENEELRETIEADQEWQRENWGR
jgi:TATA-binding protein-associated factor Taf7